MGKIERLLDRKELFGKCFFLYRKKKRKTDKNGNSKPRKPSAYILFTGDHRAKVNKEFPDLAPKDKMRKLAELWNKASEKEKAVYIAKAAAGGGDAATSDAKAAPKAAAASKPAPKSAKKKVEEVEEDEEEDNEAGTEEEEEDDMEVEDEEEDEGSDDDE